MEGHFQYQGKLDKGLEEWLYIIGSQPSHILFSEDDKQEYTRTEGLDPEIQKISNQALE